MPPQRNSELVKKFQQYNGRVVLRGNVVKDDSGSYAMFIEQGSSAKHMTSTTVLDVIARLAGGAGRASDVVSAYTQVKMEDAPKLLGLPEAECPTFWIRPPRSRHPKSWDEIQDPEVLLERRLHGRPLAGLLCERQFEKVLIENCW